MTQAVCGKVGKGVEGLACTSQGCASVNKTSRSISCYAHHVYCQAETKNSKTPCSRSCRRRCAKDIVCRCDRDEDGENQCSNALEYHSGAGRRVGDDRVAKAIVVETAKLWVIEAIVETVVDLCGIGIEKTIEDKGVVRVRLKLLILSVRMDSEKCNIHLYIAILQARQLTSCSVRIDCFGWRKKELQ